MMNDKRYAARWLGPTIGGGEKRPRKRRKYS